VTAAEIEAVIAAYQITYATPVITGGRLGDIAGRRGQLPLLADLDPRSCSAPPGAGFRSA
jgi:MFS family permease